MAEILIRRTGPIAWLVIDNPSKRNALTHDMWRAFPDRVAELAADSTVKVVVLRGAGEHFSAGADIAAVQDILHDPATGQHSGGEVTVAEKALAGLHKPVIAAVTGFCVGGGWQLAGACDIRLLSEAARVGITPGKIGIVYPLSGIAKLVELAGPAAAKYLLLSGDIIDAPEALRLGLGSQVLPVESFWDRVEAFALQVAGLSQFSAQGHKALIDALASGSPAVDRLSAAWQEEMTRSGDAAIGVAAFLAKTRPDFTWP